MKTYQALAIVPIIPDDDHVVLRIQTEEEGRMLCRLMFCCIPVPLVAATTAEDDNQM